MLPAKPSSWLTAPEDGWIPVGHFVTAFFRDAFGFDGRPIGLDAWVQSQIPEVAIQYDEVLE